jgi:2-keto-4-pentenoate hydratase/2-oxohepta-3-ene-1,7-dioic acid hydratase in catechol pathway
MKLIRFGPPGAEKPGLQLPDGSRVDATGFGEDWGERFLESHGLARLTRWAADHAAKAPRVDASERLGSAVTRPSKIVCIGLNYADHARETKAKLPEQPVVFFKATTALAGPDDDLPLPRGSAKTDWEVELAVVIGDVRRLPMWLKVNGETRQKSSTEQMIFDVPFLVSYLSRFMTLLPGDVISTGTPAGVGLGMQPPSFLKAGDVVELGIDGLGSQRQRIVASPGARP